MVLTIGFALSFGILDLSMETLPMGFPMQFGLALENRRNDRWFYFMVRERMETCCLLYDLSKQEPLTDVDLKNSYS